MINYEIGKFYNFHVKSVHDTFITIYDDDNRFFSVLSYSFQSNWDYRYKPATSISCYVKDITSDGRIILMQNKLDILKQCYKDFKNETSTFVVNKVYEFIDKPQEKRYLLEDAFGILQLYAPQTDEDKNLQEGDYIDLYICGIAQHENNLSNLILSHTFTPSAAPIQEVVPVQISAAPVADDQAEDTADDAQQKDQHKQPEFVFLNLGCENHHLEFKKTIVYTAGGIDPNIDAQMAIILKTLAGFMNLMVEPYTLVSMMLVMPQVLKMTINISIPVPKTLIPTSWIKMVLKTKSVCLSCVA